MLAAIDQLFKVGWLAAYTARAWIETLIALPPSLPSGCRARLTARAWIET